MRRSRASRFLVFTLATSILGCGGPMTPPDAADAAPPDAPDAASDGGDDAADAPPPDGPPVGNCSAMPRSFWAWDLSVMPPPDVQLMASCRLERPHLYIYSTDDVWPDALSPARAGVIAHNFEDATPADPTRGIWPLETGVFGTGPDVDGDPHVVLFYQDIAAFRTYTFDGFFRSMDESTTDPHSNQTEMLHLDTRPMDPTGEYMLGVVAHEFVHLLAYPYGDEDTWLSEMFAEAGMAMCGYYGDVRLAQRFAQTASAPLVATGMGLDYGPLFLFGDYLVERFGAQAVGDIAHDRGRGVPTVETVLARHGATFRDVFGDWTVANLVDAPHPPYGYAAFDVTTEPAARAATSGAALDGSAPAWAAQYVRLDLPSGASGADVALSSAGFANLVVHAAVYDPAARGAATVTTQALTDAMSTFTVTAPATQRRVVLVIAAAASSAVPYHLTMTAR